jgi:hypothetical protein
MAQILCYQMHKMERTSELVDYLRVIDGRNLYVDGEQMTALVKLLATLLIVQSVFMFVLLRQRWLANQAVKKVIAAIQGLKND